MSDIVERVRDLSNLLWQQGYGAGLAAAEAKVDRLEAEIEQLRKALSDVYWKRYSAYWRPDTVSVIDEMIRREGARSDGPEDSDE